MENNKYIISSAIKGEDGQIYAQSYDLINQTEAGISELIKYFKLVDSRVPKSNNDLISTGVCVQRYKYDVYDKELNPSGEIDQHNPEQFDTLYNSIDFIAIRQKNTAENKYVTPIIG